jgi:hypothetical protein
MTGSVVRCLQASAAGLLFLCLLASSGTSALPQAAFHAPQSEPERALAKILGQADKDEHLLDNLLQGRGAKTFKPTFNYETLLTTALVEAIRAHEKALVAKDCKGKYLEGEICGLDYSPITCGQDSNTRYEFRTPQAGPNIAKIEFRWPGGKTAASYRVIKAEGTWKIDGISCAGASPFNMR